MINKAITLLLIFLILFTPLAFGSMEIWAYSSMELGILLIILLAAVQRLTVQGSQGSNLPDRRSGHSILSVSIVLLALFLLLILFQMISLPSGILKILSPKTFALRSALSLEPSASSFPLSFFPFLTQIEFFKWLTLIGLFIFLLRWKPLEQGNRTTKRLIVVVMIVGVLESLYGMFEFFSGHHHILNFDGSALRFPL